MTIKRYTFECAPVRFNIHLPANVPYEKVHGLALRALYKKEVIGIEDIDHIATEEYEEAETDEWRL